MTNIVFFTDYYFLSLQDSVIHPEVEFPDIHLSTFVQFNVHVKSGHTWLYIPEQLLMPEAEYKKQQQQQKEEKIAEGMETALDLNEFVQRTYRLNQSTNQGKK